MLGDNIIEKNIREQARDFEKQKDGAMIILKKVPDPKRFGVPVFDGKRIVKIEEKPAEPKSDYAVTGLYMYDSTIFDIIKTLKPSDRGELEITDVNNSYIQKRNLVWRELEGWWTDAGTFSSLLSANKMVEETGANKV